MTKISAIPRLTFAQLIRMGLAVAFVIGLSNSAALAETAEDPRGEAIMARITERASAFEESYLGSFSRRTVETRILDGDDGKLKMTRHAVVDVWDYHGEAPTNEVRDCKIDERVEDPSECVEKRRLEPAYRLFDKDAQKHYRLEYLGVETWNETPSYRVRVVPRENTPRHLKGDVFFDVQSLRLVGMNITLADYPFGLKDLSVELNFADQDGLPVIAGGRSEAHIYVPFLINDRSITHFTASDQRLLTEHRSAAVSEGG
jgi:hypothetical protein